MMKFFLLTFINLLFIVIGSNAQLLSYNIDFPTASTNNFEITVDASKGNQGLLNYTTTDVYVHTGVITNLSTSSTNWRYVKFNQNFNLPNAALQATSLGGNKWKFTITDPNGIRGYYGVPANETILKISILFRSGNGSKKQTNIDGSDMYIPVYETGAFAVKFISPAMQPTYNTIPEPINITIPSTIPVTAVSSKNANLTLQYDAIQIGTATAAQTVSGTANVTTECQHIITVEANDNGTIKRDTINFSIAPSSYPTGVRPAGLKDGITYQNNNTEAVLILYAPLKNKVSVIGDFNNWLQTCDGFLKKDGNYFWTRITGLTPGTNYRFQYIVDDSIRVADPYSELVLDPNNDQYITSATYPNMPAYPSGKTTGGFVGVLSPGEAVYNWTSNSYVRPDKKDLMIYELLMRDFTDAQNWQTLKDTLNYIKNLGFNAIQLMPFNEFSGNNSWGYNPLYYMAPDKAYGSKNTLKAFIDAAHNLGIAVIQDIAFNQADQPSPMVWMWWNKTLNRPAANNPYFYETDQHPFSVFYDFNHNTEATKYHVSRFIRHWLTEYRIDGFRWDLSKGFTNQNCAGNQGCWDEFNQDRINIWQRYYDSMQIVSAGSYCILEHLGGDQEEAELARRGMLLWGKMTYNYTGNVKAVSGESDIDRSFWRNRSFWNASDMSDKPGLITYAESHDEERVIYSTQNNPNTNTSNSGLHDPRVLNTALRRSEAMAAFLLATPGPKMIWQFGELGYDYSINSNGGRTNPKTIRWDYYQILERRRLYETYAAMAKLRNQFKNTFRTPNLSLGTYLGSNLVKTIVVDHADLKYVVVANFDVFQQTPTVSFPANGTWYDYTNGGTISVTGNSQSITLPPGQFKVYLNQNISGGIVTNIRDVIANSSEFKLNIFPNPVTQSSTISYELPKSGKVSIQLINIQGQVVASKNMGFQLKGVQSYILNKNNFAGTNLVAGQYILQVRVENIVRYEKIVVQQ